ncbi:hypothetical protein [Mesorhizobium sp. BR-1-1-10]|uniref:hypothetical protein n=1 Tax=Mesorhizobium sp. BR-1-1-10 TaxID=2876660 RepID=UPI001CD1443E|nr:hypothetical protein [Mesorhizobium sp. BR-1-1-10]MBZ9977934.1 hypothetical protein [Mesorhizobium sp. BR-1-1-10]
MSVNIKALVAAAFLLSLVLIVNGAIPGYLSPTTGQVFWLLGFSKAFVNSTSVYSYNFGLPSPAPLSFGLSAALPAAVLLGAGVSLVNAYAVLFAGWLSVAFAGAYFLARYLEAGVLASLFAALIWCSFPMITQHHLFCALALGMALLPLYFWSCMRVVFSERLSLWSSAWLVVITIVAAFMDGYTFMMFATGTAIICVCECVKRRRSARVDLIYRAATITTAFGVAYGLYALYEGTPTLAPVELDFFRGWAANVEFFFIPTKMVLALPDLLNLSVERAQDDYFGDYTVYQGTFCTAIAGVAAYGLVTVKGNRFWLVAFGLIALFGFYMALGPTVKFFTYRPPNGPTIMPAEYGWFPTGSAVISKYLPGFNNMRASYRWAVVAIFGCWAVFVVMMASGKLSTDAKAALVAFLFMFNIPNPHQFSEAKRFHDLVQDVSDEVASWDPYFADGEKVAFLPYRNDFLINYVAADLNIKTYNIGGDKNLEWAVGDWPPEMAAFQQGAISPDFESNVRSLLKSRKADAVVLSYANMMLGAYVWPFDDDDKDQLLPIARKLDADSQFHVVFAPHFAIVRLADNLQAGG